MRLKHILFIAFLVAALIPAMTSAFLSYRAGLQREIGEVKDRNLLLAQNLSAALNRYHVDLDGALNSITQSLSVAGTNPINLDSLMTGLNIKFVVLTDIGTGDVVGRLDAVSMGTDRPVSLPSFIHHARLIAQSGKITYSPVIDGGYGQNVILGVRKYGPLMSIAVIETQYFNTLGKSISIGKMGHATIVDHRGNVISHPLADWAENRKNLSKISVVRRLMQGETGLEQFYSPAFKSEMIAGLTSVKGTGWGVMIPQPMADLRDKVWTNNKTVLIGLLIGTLVTVILVSLFLNSLINPLESFLRAIRANAKHRGITQMKDDVGLIPLREIKEIRHGYNLLANRISEANRKVSNMAYIDATTQLPNRASLDEAADKVFDDPEQVEAGGSLIFIDLDDFKRINDIHGHLVGDNFLRAIGSRLQTTLDKFVAINQRLQKEKLQPIVARVGGDEFVILIPAPIRDSDLSDLLNSIQVELAVETVSHNRILKSGASIGCARYPQDGRNMASLMKLADIAMYHAKKLGKNRHFVYSKDIGTMTESEITLAVKAGIENGEMRLEYQPLVSTKDRKTRAVEALVRWHHPTQGVVGPNKWLPALANTPVINLLDEWVIDRAMRDQLNWKKNGLHLRVAVNVGPSHFGQIGFADWTIDKATALGFDPRDMELEITEDTLFGSDVPAEDVLQRFHRAGFRIAIDDFGTGYSNMARLGQLQFDAIKIDRSIVVNACEDPRIGTVVDCICGMAAKLGCTIVAEGIETPEQIAYAMKQEVGLMQGFAFSKSLPPDALREWIVAQNCKLEKAA